MDFFSLDHCSGALCHRIIGYLVLLIAACGCCWLHKDPPGRPEHGQTQVQELGPLRPDLLPLLDQSEMSTSSPPITAHLVLGEGGRELQPPGRYPGRGGRLLPGEPSASVAAELGQPAPRHHQDDYIKYKPQPFKQNLGNREIVRSVKEHAKHLMNFIPSI